MVILWVFLLSVCNVSIVLESYFHPWMWTVHSWGIHTLIVLWIQFLSVFWSERSDSNIDSQSLSHKHTNKCQRPNIYWSFLCKLVCTAFVLVQTICNQLWIVITSQYHATQQWWEHDHLLTCRLLIIDT
jgi:hypothetical protein